MDRDRIHLTGSARYRLEILSRGPRLYATMDHQIRALARRGLIELAPDQEADGPRRWAITEIGAVALDRYAEPRRAVPHARGL